MITNIYHDNLQTLTMYLSLPTGDTAMQAVALAIGVNTTLQYLNISNNNLFNVTRNNSKNTAMSFEALDYLKHGIQENGKNHGHLHTLNLTRNPLRLTMTASSSPPQTPTDIADMVRHNEM